MPLYPPRPITLDLDLDLTVVPANVGITEIAGAVIEGPGWVQARATDVDLAEGVGSADASVYALTDEWVASGVPDDTADAFYLVQRGSVMPVRWRLFLDTPTGGTYTLTLTDDLDNVATTAPIAHDADAATIEAAILAADYGSGPILGWGTVTADGADFLLSDLSPSSGTYIFNVTVADSLDDAVPTVTQEDDPPVHILISTTSSLYYLPAGESRRIGVALDAVDLSNDPAQPLAGLVRVRITVER